MNQFSQLISSFCLMLKKIPNCSQLIVLQNLVHLRNHNLRS
ncbi:hypothetical protein pb186bvf_013655 [Paramecium bursaria]